MRRSVDPAIGYLRILLACALWLFVPSTALFQKYLGTVGVVVGFALWCLVVCLFITRRHDLEALLARTPSWLNVLLTTLPFAALLIAFLVVYPIADSGVVGGGSDGDDALNIATIALLQGRYPYYTKTYLGNPVSPLPGALLLAIPFVLLGNSAYQNLFWIVAFFVGLRSYLKSARSALLLLWAVLALSPSLWHAVVTGSDYISNSLYVFVFVLWLLTCASNPSRRNWQRSSVAILLGIGLSSRANFVFVLPLVFFALARRDGWAAAIRYTAITSITLAVVTAPFIVYDPHGFSPFHTIGELGRFHSVLPYAGYVIPVCTGIISVVLATLSQDTRNGLGQFFRNCAIVLAFPVLSGIVLSTIQLGRVDFGFSSFGTFYLFFGAVSVWVSPVWNTIHHKSGA